MSFYDKSYLFDTRIGCAICWEDLSEAPVSWNNRINASSAHTSCVEWIEDAERNLIQVINELFKNIPKEVKSEKVRLAEKRSLHYWAVAAVQKTIDTKCGKYTSLKLFAQLNGKHELTSLFNTIGIETAKEFYKIMNTKVTLSKL